MSSQVCLIYLQLAYLDRLLFMMFQPFELIICTQSRVQIEKRSITMWNNLSHLIVRPFFWWVNPNFVFLGYILGKCPLFDGVNGEKMYENVIVRRWRTSWLKSLYSAVPVHFFQQNVTPYLTLCITSVCTSAIFYMMWNGGNGFILQKIP